jgi:predicted nucleic acid-binding protein
MGLPTVRILIDTNVLLDFALGREPFFADSTQVLKWARDNPGEASVAWHSLSNLAYLVSGDVRGFLQDLLSYVEVPSVGTSDARQALHFPMSDIEDALQAVAALAFHAQWIVTRNERDYRGSPVPVLSPAKFLKQIASL